MRGGGLEGSTSGLSLLRKQAWVYRVWGYRCLKRQGRTKSALPHRISPHLGARVAPQRCPILRVGRTSIALFGVSLF